MNQCCVSNYSEIFFFISSVGFIILGILAGILLFHMTRAIKSFTRLVNKAEKDVDQLGDTAQEMLEDVRDSNVYRFVFGKKKRKKKSSTETK